MLRSPLALGSPIKPVAPPTSIERVMAVIRQTLGRQQAGKMPDVHAVCRRVRADVKRHSALVELLLQIRARHVVDQPSPL